MHRTHRTLLLSTAAAIAAEMIHIILRITIITNRECACTYLNPWQHTTCCAFANTWQHAIVFLAAFIIAFITMQNTQNKKKKI